MCVPESTMLMCAGHAGLPQGLAGRLHCGRVRPLLCCFNTGHIVLCMPCSWQLCWCSLVGMWASLLEYHYVCKRVGTVRVIAQPLVPMRPRGYVTELAMKAVASGHADAVAFGRRFLATPDLVKRVKLGAPLNQYHRETFYTQDQARPRVACPCATSSGGGSCEGRVFVQFVQKSAVRSLQVVYEGEKWSAREGAYQRRACRREAVRQRASEQAFALLFLRCGRLHALRCLLQSSRPCVLCKQFLACAAATAMRAAFLPCRPSGCSMSSVVSRESLQHRLRSPLIDPSK